MDRTMDWDGDGSRNGGGEPHVNISTTERVASVLGGAALVAYGLTRRTPAGIGMALLGGGLAYTGVTGWCDLYGALRISTAGTVDSENASIPHNRGIKVEKTLTINKPPEEVYRFWRDLENLPRFMNHLESVSANGDGRSHWVAKGPAGKKVEWDAEIVNEEENRLLAWRSLPGADVDSAGSVRFEPAPGGRGTELHVTFEYDPPMGRVGAAVAALFGEEPHQQVDEDLRRFKHLMEAGESPTTEGQPSGRNGKK